MQLLSWEYSTFLLTASSNLVMYVYSANLNFLMICLINEKVVKPEVPEIAENHKPMRKEYGSTKSVSL